MVHHTLTWGKHTLCSVYILSPPARADGGSNPAERGLHPPRRYLASQLLVRLHLGSPGLTPPCRLCTATTSSCRAARKVPGTCGCPQRPAGRVGSSPSPGGPAHPCSGGRCPRRGLESSDYLIAADTKPIFPPLSILAVVTTFFQAPVTGAHGRPACLQKASQEHSGARPAGGVQ